MIRPDGAICDDDETGEIAIRSPNPVMFLNYWKRPDATAQKYLRAKDGLGDWMLTGDRARRDRDGYVFFLGRDDDVISSAGYRIGPNEIEDGLLRHPAVANAAAVGKPDALRGEIVKAFIVLKPGFSPSPDLAKDIQDHVKSRLSAHEYPREIEFAAELPLTTSGKIIRRILREKA
jgi:acetyl-CoA synthetase